MRIVLCLSLRDFVCVDSGYDLKSIVDERLNITATQLYYMYRESLITHVMTEAEELLEDHDVEVEKAEKKIVEVNSTLSERRKHEARTRTQNSEMQEDWAKIKRLMSEIEEHISKMDCAMQNAEGNMGKVHESIV